MAAITLTIIILLNYLAFYYAYGGFEGSVGTKKKIFFSRQKSRRCAPGGGVLCISKLSPEDPLDKLEEVLRQICDAGLKVNAAKLTFCALEIEYLGYVLTRDSIKPQSNKVQAILAIKQPHTGVKQLRHFLGMVQYYHDLWARRSDMLAPLTSLVGDGGQTKTTKAKGTKKVPWYWDEVHQKSIQSRKSYNC